MSARRIHPVDDIREIFWTILGAKSQAYRQKLAASRNERQNLLSSFRVLDLVETGHRIQEREVSRTSRLGNDLACLPGVIRIPKNSGIHSPVVHNNAPFPCSLVLRRGLPRRERRAAPRGIPSD